MAPANEEKVAELREELSAIEFAESAMDVATHEMTKLGATLPSVLKDITDDALARKGLEKTGDKSVGEFVPKVAELERVDGVLDASGGAEETVIVDRIVADEEGNAKIVPTKIAANAPADSEVSARKARTTPNAA